MANGKVCVLSMTRRMRLASTSLEDAAECSAASSFLHILSSFSRGLGAEADHVMSLIAEDGSVVMGLIVEAQLAIDERKRYVWPEYVTALRARLESPVRLVVVTLDQRVARWAAKPIEIGCGYIIPRVLGPAQIVAVTDDEVAAADPETAVLSVMAHGRSANVHKAAQMGRAALRASTGLDDDRAWIYCDLVHASLSGAAAEELRAMKATEYVYQSDFAKGYLAQGEAKLIARQLTLRFGQLSSADQARIDKASIAELDLIGERLLTSSTLREALGGV